MGDSAVAIDPCTTAANDDTNPNLVSVDAFAARRLINWAMAEEDAVGGRPRLNLVKSGGPASPVNERKALDHRLPLDRPVVQTERLEDVVIDFATGDVLAVYTVPEFAPEPRSVYGIDTEYLEPVNGLVRYRRRFYVDASHPGGPKAEKESKKRNKVFTISNPLVLFFSVIQAEEHHLSWLDDIVRGAIGTGPGIWNGKESVRARGVYRVLRLPEISTRTAEEVLFNHHFEQMSSRQVERYVEAARIALGGIVHYLQCHPEQLESLELDIDLSGYVLSTVDARKDEAFAMLADGKKKVEIYTKLAISNHTLNAWIKAKNEAEGVITKKHCKPSSTKARAKK
ncbi:hypothetical protein [Pseudomonas sp. PDM19]|uniref:hypothetical protein n=1 Tax=Pseudomonas sp. PDM19 TaxID=2769272 RepID=UPI001784071A|nr:hypothetical protein [Pseudomonas sp. PDM19]MBD9631410.1 hypothetical protein [Pseudomonas sp. PDM19]